MEVRGRCGGPRRRRPAPPRTGVGEKVAVRTDELAGSWSWAPLLPRRRSRRPDPGAAGSWSRVRSPQPGHDPGHGAAASPHGPSPGGTYAVREALLASRTGPATRGDEGGGLPRPTGRNAAGRPTHPMKPAARRPEESARPGARHHVRSTRTPGRRTRPAPAPSHGNGRPAPRPRAAPAVRAAPPGEAPTEKPHGRRRRAASDELADHGRPGRAGRRPTRPGTRRPAVGAPARSARRGGARTAAGAPREGGRGRSPGPSGPAAGTVSNGRGAAARAARRAVRPRPALPKRRPVPGPGRTASAYRRTRCRTHAPHAPAYLRTGNNLAIRDHGS